MRWKTHSEALRVAHAVAQEFELEVKDAGTMRLTWPRFTGIKPQEGFRVSMQRGPRIVSVTTRRRRGHPLCDIKVSTAKGDWEWTQLPMSGSDIFPLRHILSGISEKLYPPRRDK